MNLYFFPYKGLVFGDGTEIGMDALGQEWQVPTGSVDSAELRDLFCRIEHRDDFYRVIQELWRVAAPDAILKLDLPHPRHDTWLLDPGYVRPLLADTLKTFQRHEWNSPLADRLGVNFEITEVTVSLDAHWQQALSSGAVTEADIGQVAQQAANVIEWQSIQWVARKGEVVRSASVAENNAGMGLTADMRAQLQSQAEAYIARGDTENARKVAQFLSTAPEVTEPVPA